MDRYPDNMPTYAIGQQDFGILRENGSVYVDKTYYIDLILRQKVQYLFLARPRRFGKSLFQSTLQYFFEGRRDLFKGLYIDSTDWDWEKYPVLHLDFNPNRYHSPQDLDRRLESLFKEWEKKYDLTDDGLGYSERFATIIKTAHEKSGRRVVILVDEYDKPLVTSLNKKSGDFESFREKLASLYSNFKSSAAHIQLVFITGVSRFGKLSVFSDLNNLRDLTFSNEFSAICGITEEELRHYFTPGIEYLASKSRISFDEACGRLKACYDGYRFSAEGRDIYNPWSILYAMLEADISDYWNRTGQPTIVVQALKNRKVDLEKILNTRCSKAILEGLDLSNAEPLPLLYQTGYLTIKDYDPRTQLYRLGLPNQETTRGLMNELLPYYVDMPSEEPKWVVNDIVASMLLGEPGRMMESLDIFFASIPYEMKMENENNVQNAIFILLSLISVEVRTEVHTSNGRIDLMLETPDYLYIIELKFGKDSQTAAAQIEEKEYDLPFRRDGRPIFRIGSSFNPETRRFDKPVIKEGERIL